MMLFCLLIIGLFAACAAAYLLYYRALQVRRIRFPRRTVRLLRAAVKRLGSADELHADALRLMEALVLVRQQVRQSEPLPVGRSGRPRMDEAASALVQEGRCSLEDLLQTLPALPGTVTSAEAAGLALCVENALCRHIGELLRALLDVPKERGRSMEVCRDQLRQAVSDLHALRQTAWLAHCEALDEAHHLLMQDPDGVYPRMTPDDRLQLRLRVERFCRHVRMDARDVLPTATALCQADDGPEGGLCALFTDARLMTRLHNALRVRRGWLYARWSCRRFARRLSVLWGAGIAACFLFLQAGNPVWMLPMFALAFGGLVRALLPEKPDWLPRMQLPAAADGLRTLIVLPSALQDEHAAIAAVRRIKVLQSAFPDAEADFLLLGLTSSKSAAHAAASALAALNEGADRPALFLQCLQTEDAELLPAAIQLICAHIVNGECPKPIAGSSFDTADLYRKYDFALVVGEDATPSPLALQELLSAACHPLCTPLPTPGGQTGHAALACEGQSDVRLLSPSACQESLSLLDGSAAPLLLTDALTGCTAVPGALCGQEAPVSLSGLLADAHLAAHQAWSCAGWQLPYVQTASGVVRNPLGRTARFRLRQALRASLLPAARVILLVYALLTAQPLLCLIALIPGDWRGLRRADWPSMLRRACRFALLPARAAVSIWSAWNALLHKPVGDDAALLRCEIWAQGLAAAVLTALGILLPPSGLVCLTLAAAFACFPWSHRLYDMPESPQALSEEELAFLRASAAGCWRTFEQQVSAAAPGLPPAWIQQDPPLGPSGFTCPEAIGGYLLSIVCAKELGLISVGEAADRLSAVCAALGELPLPDGLPCRRYALPGLSALDPGVDADAAGLLYCACLICAQALRSWLPELHPAHMSLSAMLDDFADRMDIARLYNPDAGLLHAGVDPQGQPRGLIRHVCHETLPLSLAACARRKLPRTHLARLSHARIWLRGGAVQLSMHGTAAEQLLPGLFLPMDDNAARSYVRAMRRMGLHGLFGQGRCAWLEADAALQLRRGEFGVTGCAVQPGLSGPVYAPYAAALCLPVCPGEAARCLMQMAEQGAACPWGFWDALDARDGMKHVPLVEMHHQAILLLALTHALCGAPIQRYFLALPEVEACLALLRRPSDAPSLPALPVAARPFFRHPGFELHPDRDVHPGAAHLLGSQNMRLMVDACGRQALHLEGSAIFQPSSATPSGLQCYLRDEQQVYRVGDPLLPGECVFLPGEARFRQVCGPVSAELRIAADTAHGQLLYVLTLTNLSDRARTVEAASCLLPDLPAGTAAVQHGPERHLALVHLPCGGELHHCLHADVPLEACTVCTDAEAFLGRGRTLANPALLTEPMANAAWPALHPCLSFRARFTLGGRAQARLCFSISAQDQPCPDLSALDGILRMGAMQQRALAGDLCLSEEQLQAAFLLAGLILHHLPQEPFPLTLSLDSGEGFPVLDDLCAACRWLCAHGVRVRLHLLCTAELAALLPSQVLAENAPQVLICSADEAHSALLTLSGHAPLLQQLQALQAPASTGCAMPLPPAPSSPDDAPTLTCGFDAEGCDYVVQLSPGMTTPAPWQNVHRSHGWRETVTDASLGGPYREEVLVRLEDGTAFTPWSTELPRVVRFGRGETVWHAQSQDCTLALHVAVMPSQRCGLRTLRLHNELARPVSAQVQVTAVLPEGSVRLHDGYAFGEGADDFIGGVGWEVRSTVPGLLTLPDGSPAWQPASVPGQAVVMMQTLTIPANGSAEALWLSGRSANPARTMDTAARLLTDGTSGPLRSLRRAWADRIPLSVSTPDDALNCLMNRILPVQCLTGEGLSGLPALAFLSPREALRRLLRAAIGAQSAQDWLQVALHTAFLARRLPAGSLLQARLPGTSTTLQEACEEALLSLPLDENGLPLTEDPVRDLFLYATAAGQLSKLRPSAALDDLRRQLLNTADSRLWHDGFYGQDGCLRLDVQALADTAYGSDARTSMAVRKAWSTLWQPDTGILRQLLPRENGLLPGMPENGGMQLLPAAGFLASLLRHGMMDEAETLLRAMNPLHRTGTPLACEQFRAAPYRLPGSILAAPMEAGRALDAGGDAAAGLLYVIVLERLLGFRLQGDLLCMHPHIPADWDGFTLTRQLGASTWHISVERHRTAPSMDGNPIKGNQVTLFDDGRVHQLRFPTV